MGVELSRNDPDPQPASKGGRERLPTLHASRSVAAKWKKRRVAVPFFAVIRHEERADIMNATVDGQVWTHTADFGNWPVDPPLSDVGAARAPKIGQRLRALEETCGSKLHVVVSSPYLRCVQTAVAICQQLGPEVRILVDHSLGEVYGPSIMGENEPIAVTRPMADIQAFCKAKGVECEMQTVGAWPVWPEDLGSARSRYANRFLRYLHRSKLAHRNFALVTHADCVGSSLRMLPSTSSQVVEKVNYGGMFVAVKRRGHFHGLLNTRHWGEDGATVRSRSCEPSAPQAQGCPQSRGVPYSDSWLQESDSPAGVRRAGGSRSVPSEGWAVKVDNVDLRRSTSKRSFMKTVQSMIKTSTLSMERIQELLGGLADLPLGGEASTEAHRPPCFSPRRSSTSPSRRDPTSSRRCSLSDGFCSTSTYLFGASDLGLEDAGALHRQAGDQSMESQGVRSTDRRGRDFVGVGELRERRPSREEPLVKPISEGDERRSSVAAAWKGEPCPVILCDSPVAAARKLPGSPLGPTKLRTLGSSALFKRRQAATRVADSDDKLGS